jgi:hypothetical protein
MKTVVELVPVLPGVGTADGPTFETDILDIDLVYTTEEEGAIRSLTLHLASFSVII